MVKLHGVALIGGSVKLARVERVTKEYDDQGRIVQESWEYYYPSDAEGGGKSIGFNQSKK